MAEFYDDATKWKIEHAGRVPLPVAQTVEGFFCGIAILTVVGRIVVRLTIRRRLFPDDYILLFALATLLSATGVLYKFDWIIYVLNILKYDHTVIPTVSDLKQIMDGQKINYTLVALIWSTICSVKICFLVSFKSLIGNVSKKIMWWYWGTCILIGCFWAVMVALSWIECPYSGSALIEHCTPEPPYGPMVAGIWVAFAFDATTDIMIVSIPIWILRHVRIRLIQKLTIATFLCLSIVMIILALIRACMSRRFGWGDLATEYVLLYVEACVAVTMGAIASYRAVFVEHSRQKEQLQQDLREQQQRDMARNGNAGMGMQLPQIPADTLRGRIRQLREESHTLHGSEPSERRKSGGLLKGPKLVGSTMSDALSFIRGVGRTKQEPSVSWGSELGTLDSAYFSERKHMNSEEVSRGESRGSGST